MDRKRVGPRQLVVLRILKEYQAPIRGYQLHNAGNEDPLYQKARGEGFWKEDFSFFMKGMVKRGLVQKIELPLNQVFYSLTREGFSAYLAQCEPKRALAFEVLKATRMLKRALRYYHGDKELGELLAIARTLPAENVSKMIIRYVGNEKGRSDFRRSQDPNSAYAADEQMKVAKIYGGLLELLEPTLADKTRAETTKVAEAQFIYQHEKDIAHRATIVTKVLGYCIFCGAQIHNEEAHRDEQLLKKYAGAKTGMVCCSCFRNLEWVEKYLTVKEVIDDASVATA